MAVATMLVPMLLFAEQIALGANGALLGVAAATADIGAAIMVVLLILPDNRFWREAWPVLLALAAAIVWLAAPSLVPAAFAWAPERPAPDLFLPGMVRIFGGIAILLAGAWTGYRRGLMRRALRWNLALGILAIVIGATLRQIDPDHVWGFDKNIMGQRFTGTLLNANSGAALFAVTAIMGLSSALDALRTGRFETLKRESARWWFVGCIGCVAGLLACAETGSRTVLIVLAVAAVGLAATDRLLRSLALSWIGAISVAISGITLAFIALVAGDQTIARFNTLDEGLTERIAIFSHYWKAMLLSPWTGYGPLSFDALSMRMMESPADAIHFWYIHAPHNAALAILLTGGLPYFAFLLLALGLMLFQIVSARRDDRQDPLVRGTVVSVALVGVSSMVDIQLDVPAVSALTLYLTALIWGKAVRVRADRRSAGCADQGAR